MDNKKIKVIYITGVHRSGSTLLELILGQISACVSVGQLHRSWGPSFGKKFLCGCGEPFRQCEFWIDVAKEAFGGFDKVPVNNLNQLRYSSAVKDRHIPNMLWPWKIPYYSARLNKYSEIFTRLYEAILKVSGCKIIIDSSKDPDNLFFLNKIPTIDLHILHLVRDSRGVAFSRLRKKALRRDPKAFMPIFPPWFTAFRWVTRNMLVEFARILGVPYTLVRYEELIADPPGTIAAIVDAFEIQPEDLSFIDRDTLKLEVINHTTIVNPMRFQQGDVIKLKPDFEWHEKMTSKAYWTVTNLTFPLLWRYGYSIFNRIEKSPNYK